MLRALVACFVLVVILEGAVRKWILPEYTNEIFLLKDVLLAAAFAAYALQWRRGSSAPRDLAVWLVWALFVAGYAAVAGFSFESMVGLRYYLAPLPLLLLVPALIREPADLDRIAAWAARLALPIGVLATVQYLSPLDSPLNTYAWGGEGSGFGIEEDELVYGHLRPRVTATFSYISTYAAFLTAVWLLAWLSLLHARSRFDRSLAGLALVLIAFNMGMNGSRGLLLIALAAALPFALLWVHRLGSLRSQLLAAAFAIVLATVGTIAVEPFALTVARGEDGEEVERFLAVLLMPFATLAEADLLGAGLGSTFGGYEQLGHRASADFDEINVDRIGIELGALGYLFLLFLKLLMLGKAFRAYRHATSPVLGHWALAALLIQGSTGWQIPFYNAVAAIYYFGAIGLIYWIETFERRQRSAAARRVRRARDESGFAARGWR